MTSNLGLELPVLMSSLMIQHDFKCQISLVPVLTSFKFVYFQVTLKYQRVRLVRFAPGLRLQGHHPVGTPSPEKFQNISI